MELRKGRLQEPMLSIPFRVLFIVLLPVSIILFCFFYSSMSWFAIVPGIIGLVLVFMKHGYGVDTKNNIYRFYSVFGIDKRLYYDIESISKIRINKVLYSHYTGFSAYHGTSATTENKNLVYDVEAYNNNKSVMVVSRCKDKERVELLANYLSESLKVDLKRNKIDLNKLDTKVKW